MARTNVSDLQDDEDRAWRDTVTAHRRAVQDHAREPVDPAWAAPATEHLREDLERMAPAGHFRVLSADCRTVTCLADVIFESFAAARAKWGTLVHGRYRNNCGVEVILDPVPGDVNAPYETGVVYKCVDRAPTTSVAHD